jgi:voltage-gated potassium channel
VARVNIIERSFARFLSKPPSVRAASTTIVLATAAVVVLSGILMRFVDHKEYANVWVGMWWAMQTVTTVGYGDVVPEQTAGKVVAAFLMLGGLSLFAVITGAITSAFVAQAQARSGMSEEEPMMRKLDEMTTELAAMKAELARLHRRPD